MDKIFNNVRTKYLNKLLNTRKQRFSFIKLYLINEYHIEFNAKRLKQVLYDEVLPTEEYEEEMYNLYNIYTNLLNDCLSNTFFIDKNISIDYFNFDNVISSVLLLYDSNIEIIFLFMIMNYLLLKNNLPIINQYKKYNRFVNSLQKHDEDELYSLIIESINNLNPFDIDYYKNTKETTKELIVSFVKDNESIIKNEGKIKRMFLFGSYASGLTRFDSDIDFLVIIKDDLTFEEKVSGIRFVKELIEKRFNRITDIHETTLDLLEIEKDRIQEKIDIF